MCSKVHPNYKVLRLGGVGRGVGAPYPHLLEPIIREETKRGYYLVATCNSIESKQQHGLLGGQAEPLGMFRVFPFSMRVGVIFP